MKKLRADELLFIQGKASSRTSAKILIMAGKVRAGPDSLVSKPSQMFSETTELFVSVSQKFVSRGGEKLFGALSLFQINVNGLNVLDVGASTGGFTDCLLQNGAASATCLDVGKGQLHSKILNDSRVSNFEKINAKDLEKVNLPRAVYDIVVGDISFISLKKVLPAIWNRVSENGRLVFLIKPQFEATKEEASKFKGIIKSPEIHQRVVDEIIKFSEESLVGFELKGICESPIKGGDGNKEFLFCALKTDKVAPRFRGCNTSC